jgi:ApbE superfamily uncharacterized protein (UPF0280 family)
MANALYAKGREGFLAGTNDWDTNTIKVTCVDAADYTKDLATHDNYDDVPSGARVATSSALSGKSVTDGVADAGDESTSSLLVNIDTAAGLPVTPNGGDVTVTWDNGSNKIFVL